MDEPLISSTFSVEVPHPHAWPYRRAYSAGSVVYYQLSEDVALPVYDARFWSLVGRHVKVLGHILVENGCYFVPQSEGQFLSRYDLKSAWNTIKGEEKVIRKSGLMLTDFETGEQLSLANATYRLPWPTFEDFESDVKPKLQTGCVYLLIPQRLEKIAIQMKEKPYFGQYSTIELIYDLLIAADSQGQEQQFALFCATVDTETPEEQSEGWKNLTNYVYGLLKGA